MTDRDEFDLFETMFDRHVKWPPHADLDFCIQKGYWGMLETLLSYIQHKLNLVEYIEKRYFLQ